MKKITKYYKRLRVSYIRTALLVIIINILFIPSYVKYQPDGENLFQGTDGGQAAQMGGTVPLSLCPGDQAIFYIVVDHGGGQSLAVVEVDQLPGQIANQLVHVQSDVGQCVPVSRPLLFQAGFQIQ